jgi:hypothetical protein
LALVVALFVLRLASLGAKQNYWEFFIVRAKARTYLRNKCKSKKQEARAKAEARSRSSAYGEG